jgi:predicted transcriptional regulator
MPEEVKTETITYTRRKKVVNKKAVTFKIEKTLLEKLDEYAARENMKKIDVIEFALKKYMEAQEE